MLSKASPQLLRGIATTVAASSNGAALPQSTINVVATAGAATAGVAIVQTSKGMQAVPYTNTTGTTLTGCTLGTGVLATGGAVWLPISLSASGNMDTPDGSTLGIPVQTGDAQTAKVWVYYTSANNTGAPQVVVWESPNGSKPTTTAVLQANWGPMCVENVSAAVAVSTTGAPVVTGYAVPVNPDVRRLPAVPSGTTLTFPMPIDCRDSTWLAVTCAEYGATGSPGSVLAFVTAQT